MFVLNHSSSIVLKCSTWSIGGISSVPSDTNKDFPNWNQPLEPSLIEELFRLKDFD